MSFIGSSDEAKTIITNIQDNKHERKSVYNPYTKKFQLKKRKRHPLIPNKLPYYPSTESNWAGDVMNRNPSRGHLRFWVQNCNGIKINDDSNINHLFTQLHEYGVNYFSFPESNLNTSNAMAVSKLHRMFKSRFRPVEWQLPILLVFRRAHIFNRAVFLVDSTQQSTLATYRVNVMKLGDGTVTYYVEN